MGELFIERGNSLRTTGISNVFIDEYMPQAQEECVKVYLYIIRCFSDRAKELSMEAFAKALNMDEESILNGFRYWQEQGLLTVCFDDEGEVSGIRVNECLSKKKNEFIKPVKRKFNASDISKKIGDEEFAGMLFAVSTYLDKQTLTPNETNSLIYIMEDLGFDEDLTLFLVEHCVAEHHKSMRYVEKIAISWAELGISDVKAAREYLKENRAEYKTILKAFGIEGRTVEAGEKAYIDKWFDNFGFSADIIICACNRTLLKTKIPSFSYADRILENWHKIGVKNLDDVSESDRAFKKENYGQIKKMDFSAATYKGENKEVNNKSEYDSYTQKKSSVKSSNSEKGNVKTFPQRQYDYDELERVLAAKRG